MENKVITVTSPLLPSLDDFIPYLQDIWNRKWLTNNGHYHQELEKALCEYLKVPYISLFTNGTLPLICALQALRITGEVITTPYSFVATTHSLWWNGIKPVFVDIDPVTCNAGDMSTLSFHATKVYNTIEGGALICHDEKIKKRIDYLKNFGFAGETEIVAPGINGKVDEIRAAYGLLNLKQVDSAIEARHQTAIKYRKVLEDVEGISFMEDMPGVRHNYSYFPIFVDAEKYGMTRDELYFKMKERNVLGRRYFYPLISEFSTYRGLESAKLENLAVSHKVADSVICLPMYHTLSEEEVNRVIKCIVDE